MQRALGGGVEFVAAMAQVAIEQGMKATPLIVGIEAVNEQPGTLQCFEALRGGVAI